MNQIIGKFKKIIHVRTMIMLSISIIFGMVLWLVPLQKTIDVGGFDTPWVSEFYAPQTKNHTSYRWSHVPGQILFMGVGDGDYSMRIVMRSMQTTSVKIIVDGVVANVVTVSNQFTEYTTSVQLTQRHASTLMVELQCNQPQIDGTRPVCVAVDSVTLSPRAIPIPPIWPLVGTVLLLFGMMLLVWEYCHDWRWVVGSGVSVGVIFVLDSLLLLVALPYLLIILCALGIWRYSVTQPTTVYWQGVQLCIVAAIITLARFAFQGSVGLMLEDEGYLWYGSQRILAGEIPIRDFYAYEPFRYIWSAFVMLLWGSQGIIATRIATAIVEWITLSCVGIVAIQVKFAWRTIAFPLAIAAMLFWFYPRFKIFDLMIVWLMATIFIHWMQSPSFRTSLWAGILVGFAAILGRNHGLYMGMAGICLVVYLWLSPITWHQRRMIAIGWGSGVCIGYAPMVLLMLIVPSFGSAYIHEVFTNAADWATPYAWPWQSKTISGWFYGWWLIIPTVSYIATLCYVAWQRIKQRDASVAMVVASILGVIYLHRIYLRADNTHLAQSLGPFFLLMLIWGATFGRRWQIVLMVTLCMWSGYVNWRMFSQSTLGIFVDSQEVTVGGDQLTVTNATAKQLAMYNALQQKYNPTHASFMAVPYVPGIYAVWQQRSPIYYNYAVVAVMLTEAFQQQEIAGIRQMQPRFILVDDQYLDNNKELQFSKQYAVVDQYIRTQYVLVKDPIVAKKMRLYIPKP